LGQHLVGLALRQLLGLGELLRKVAQRENRSCTAAEAFVALVVDFGTLPCRLSSEFAIQASSAILMTDISVRVSELLAVSRALLVEITETL
jgi:hypothetical protein